MRVHDERQPQPFTSEDRMELVAAEITRCADPAEAQEIAEVWAPKLGRPVGWMQIGALWLVVALRDRSPLAGYCGQNRIEPDVGESPADTWKTSQG